MEPIKYTHVTKKGFGGIMAEGIECIIVIRNHSSVAVQMKGRGHLSGIPPLFWGNVNDLLPIEQANFKTSLN